MIKSKFVKFWKRADKEMEVVALKAPKAWIIFWILIIFPVVMGLSTIFANDLGMLFIKYQNTGIIPFEVEGSCNTGFIGLDFSERFVFNESSEKKELLSYNPQKLNIKNIDGLNCNFKVKGGIPYSEVLKWH